jgi:nitrile hydratase accessory protein
MQTRFEQFAAASMLGSADSPPRDNGSLRFERPWEGRAFGTAIALSKQGHYEWEEFRQGLMASIAQWEGQHSLDHPSWDYYQRSLLALERLVLDYTIVDPQELSARTGEQLTGLQAYTSKACP